MPKLCCFTCPAADYEERAPDDKCPTCGRAYSYYSENLPGQIGEFHVSKALGRGFYSIAYVAETQRLGRKRVLKVSPKTIYTFFKKDFQAESKEHSKISEGSQHIVDIIDYFDADVTFGGIELSCHVTVLEYLEGLPLAEFLKEERTVPEIAQMAIDLFRILGEFRAAGKSHNDLHGENIIMQNVSQRPNAFDSNHKAVVIDLASVSDASKSSTEQCRLGDIHWIVRHLQEMGDKLLRNPDRPSDLEYRMAICLQNIAKELSPRPENQRTPAAEDLIGRIESEFEQVSRPWNENLQLSTFGASYNAQTLAPWFAPLLLVDEDDHWLKRMSVPGPQIITGMRGCGKTLLLHALEFHARGARRDGEDPEEILRRLKSDNFVGLYVSATRLLDKLGGAADLVSWKPYERLYVAYGLQALRAIRHLQDIKKDQVSQSYVELIGHAVADYLRGPADFKNAVAMHDLERLLLEAQVSLGKDDTPYVLHDSPSTAFQHLASAIRRCSPLWSSAYILFLLDDVSTRYLTKDRIAELLSKIMFQDPLCAFKITSEAQTLELGLQSPGMIEKARIGRDYDVFDLGAEVYSKIASSAKGREFVEKILKQRAKYYPQHPHAGPKDLLGDSSLESVAQQIAASSRTSGDKKKIYHGITALARVCVGDIGDVISLYESILRKSVGKSSPIPVEIQSDAFQDFCSRRLYDLNRRGGRLKDCAISFAEASHDLLVQSYQKNQKNPGLRQRLRQYLSIYVRITAGNIAEQRDQLIELVDSGLFVFAGGSDAPRTKTKDADPILQFKLTYRKIYGLSSFIGLAESDRYELSGDQLAEWLTSPSKEILMRNLDSGDGNAELVDAAEASPSPAMSDENSVPADLQPSLFGPLPNVFEEKGGAPADSMASFLDNVPEVRELTLQGLSAVGIDTLITANGFEPRAAASMTRLSEVVKPDKTILLQYRQASGSGEIENIIRGMSREIANLSYPGEFDRSGGINGKKILIDVSGMVKPAIFQFVREALKRNRRVWICHTSAQTYYPTDADITKALEAETQRNHFALIEELSKILTGEVGPYKIHSLHSSDVDESRRRVLVAFSSAKHERLFSLLEGRDYDRVEIVVPDSPSPWSRLSRIVGDVAARNSSNNANLTPIRPNDLKGTIEVLARLFHRWYATCGYNFELALTGSKLQGVACAAFSASFKVSRCVYVSPGRYDQEKFTHGVGQTQCYEISLR